MNRYASDLARHLRLLGVDVRFHHLPYLFGRLVRSPAAMAKWLGYFDKFILGWPALWYAGRRKGLVWHVIDQGMGGLALALPARQLVMTCHDLIAIERALFEESATQARFSTGRVLQAWNLAGLRRARRIIAISEETARRVRAVVGAETPLSVIPNALGDVFHVPAPAAAAQARTNLGVEDGTPYFLHLGSNSFYKNRVGVVRLFGELVRRPRFREFKLVLAGAEPDQALQSAIDASGVSERIEVLIRPADADVVALYAGAQALLFISLLEGFGWPLIEAQACGCPVVTSDRPPMCDVVGDTAILVNPDDPAGAAAILDTRWNERDQLIARGLENAAGYRADQVYGEYLAHYGNEAIAPPPR